MISEYVGVYHADGGLVGEAKYVVSHLLGRMHCSLCDITHSPLRRKRQWDLFVARLPVPFRLYHLNEMPTDVAELVHSVGSPLVLSRDNAGALHVVLMPAQLDRLDGSVEGLAAALAPV